MEMKRQDSFSDLYLWAEKLEEHYNQEGYKRGCKKRDFYNIVLAICLNVSIPAAMIKETAEVCNFC